MAKGIDVSQHNGEIDFKAVRNDGIKFVIIRAGYGNDISQKDKQFESNYKKAKAAGLKIGVYWFSYARTAAEAEKEARVCLSVLNKREIDLPVFFDWENDSLRYCKENGVNITKAKVTGFANRFMKRIRKDGYGAGLYSNVDYLTNYFQYDKLENCPLWVASWGSTKPKKYSGAMLWQYTDSANVKGISGLVDMNIFYSDFSEKVPVKKTAKEEKYVIGKEYKLLNEMAVRRGAGVTYALVGYRNLTEDGKKHDRDCDGYLDTGTIVTCMGVSKNSNGDIWIKIPSGWVAAKFRGVTYIE